MTVAVPRILVGRIFHEAHSFNPAATGAAAFDVRCGADLLDGPALRGSILGGIVSRLTRRGVCVVPSVSAVARPGGPVAHAVYDGFKSALLEMAGKSRIDGVALDLHGAMLTDRLDDPEGDLLQALRAAVGPGPIIGVGLDLHAHVTSTMLGAADICVACKTNPHSDFPETGRRLADLVLAAVAGRLDPVMACARLPMILPGMTETTDGPLATLHAQARDWVARHRALRDISIVNTQPFIDVPRAGQVILAVADRDPSPARAAVADLARTMWRGRHGFKSALPSIDAALDVVQQRPAARPFVLGDQGDRVLAGAPGDSNAILRRILERHPGLRAVVPITDPEAVAIAHAAGAGAELTLSVGGKIAPGLGPLPITARVVHLSDGRFVMRGPFLAGQDSTLGATAVVEVGSVKVLLTALAGFTQDVAAYTSQGIDPARHDLIVVKSGHHFKLSFDGIATPLVVGSPGLSLYAPGALPFRHRRPVWPEDEIDLADPVPCLFGRSIPASCGAPNDRPQSPQTSRPRRKECAMQKRLPKHGSSWRELKEALIDVKRDDYNWRRGRVPLYVYYRDQELLQVASEAYTLFFSENALGRRAFPSLGRLETDVVDMALALFHAGERAGGSFTSGGTESIFQAVKTARDRCRAGRPGIDRPTIVVPRTAHPAFDKAGHILGVGVRRVPVRDDYRADVEAMAAAITPETIMLVGSAPSYPHGVFDPLDELSRLALAREVWLHVDACLGGFLSPFVAKAGYPVPAFDFALPGVTSLSADLHKYGYAAKGASVVLFRDAALQRHQRFEFRDWPRGLYGTETFLGTRPGGPIAAAWAVMNHLGEDGYVQIARSIMDTKARLIAGIRAIDGLAIVEPNDLCILLYRSCDPAVDINAVADAMGERGWFVGRSMEPPAVHLALNTVHAPIVDDYLDDLRRAVRRVRDTRTVGTIDEQTY